MAASTARLSRNPFRPDRKSTRLNSSHLVISYAVFCLKKKTLVITVEPDHLQGIDPTGRGLQNDSPTFGIEAVCATDFCCITSLGCGTWTPESSDTRIH